MSITRDVAAKFQMHASRHNMVGGNFISQLQEHFALEIKRQRPGLGRFPDSLLADDFHRLSRRCGKQHHTVIKPKTLWHLPAGIIQAQLGGGLAWINQISR